MGVEVESVGPRVVGSVLNDFDIDSQYGYYSRYYYYYHYPESGDKKSKKKA